MQGWTEFTLAMLAFLGSHMIPARPGVRAGLIAALGQRAYFAGYSLLSTGLLLWLVIAAARAPYVEVIPPWPVLRWVPPVVMLAVCPLIVAGLTIRNPLSFGGMGRAEFDPERPGILALTRHPLPLALFLWSLAHLLANGSLAHVILFGIFAVFSWMGMVLIDRRKHRQLGAEWEDLARNTARFAPSHLGALLRPAALIGGVLLYLVLFMGHEWVIGISPIP